MIVLIIFGILAILYCKSQMFKITKEAGLTDEEATMVVEEATKDCLYNKNSKIDVKTQKLLVRIALGICLFPVAFGLFYVIFC